MIGCYGHLSSLYVSGKSPSFAYYALMHLEFSLIHMSYLIIAHASVCPRPCSPQVVELTGDAHILLIFHYLRFFCFAPAPALCRWLS